MYCFRIPMEQQLQKIYSSVVAWRGLKRQITSVLDCERHSQPLAFVPASLKAFWHTDTHYSHTLTFVSTFQGHIDTHYLLTETLWHCTYVQRTQWHSLLTQTRSDIEHTAQEHSDTQSSSTHSLTFEPAPKDTISLTVYTTRPQLNN